MLVGVRQLLTLKCRPKPDIHGKATGDSWRVIRENVGAVAGGTDKLAVEIMEGLTASGGFPAVR